MKINKTIISDNFTVERVASPSRLEFNLVLMPLRLDDFNGGFPQLLEDLTKINWNLVSMKCTEFSIIT